jgi:hypothetical protein
MQDDAEAVGATTIASDRHGCWLKTLVVGALTGLTGETYEDKPDHSDATFT